MPYNRYRKTKLKKDPQGRRCLEGTIYPHIPPRTYDKYIYTKFGDRLDSIANQYYGHVNYWWVIAQANGLVSGNFGIKPGTYLRIPNDISEVVKEYEVLNRKG